MAGPAIADVLPLHLATFTFPETQPPFAGQEGEVLGFAIRHRHGIVLFDTGIGAGNAFIDKYFKPVRRELEEALAAHGHRLGDVTAIVNSHLHFDHCGNNVLFPGVPIYAQVRELAAAQDARYTVPNWVSFEGAEYRSIDGDHDIAPEMRIIATPGHTDGHQSLVVGADGDEPIVLAGQAIYRRSELEQIVETGLPAEEYAPPDVGHYLASVQNLLALHPRRVHFSHDHDVWEPCH